MRGWGAAAFGIVLLTTMTVIYTTLCAIGWRSPPDTWVLYTLLPCLVLLVSLGPLYRPQSPTRHGDDDGGDTW